MKSHQTTARGSTRKFRVRVFGPDEHIRDSWIVSAPSSKNVGELVAADPRITPTTDYVVTEILE